MAVAVQRLNLPVRDVDPLDQIAKAIGVAGQVYGIKDAMQKSELLNQELALKKNLMDPTSKESVASRERYKAYGVNVPEDASAKTLSEQYGPLHEYATKTYEYEKFKKPELEEKKAERIATKEAKAEEQKYQRSQDVVKQETEIRKELNAEQTIKNAKSMREGYNSIIELAKNPSPSNDSALLYKHIKGLDSATGVKDSEIQLVQNIGGTRQKLEAMYKDVIAGTAKLTDAQRADIVNANRILMNAQLGVANNIIDQYVNKYGKGYDRSKFAPDIGQPEYTRDEIQAALIKKQGMRATIPEKKGP